MSQRREDPSRQDDLGVVTERKKKLARPPLYKVILHNDDYTTMEFVVMILQSVFDKPQAEAVQIMLHIHKRGIGIAGVYTHEIAETKVAQVHALAEENDYPLKCTLEEA
ncbi:MAG: ATP-dependent Clp protease adapter ClpS [Deltaproteobacteria bacterium]|nr:ATP-dependent Clp protease adapter ClpS [Deltaproteobacteria bacterium]